MDCCSCFEFFRRKHSAVETKSFTPPFITHLSEEHLLSYKEEDSPSATSKVSRHKSVAPGNCFRPSYPIEDASSDVIDANNGNSIEIRQNCDAKVSSCQNGAHGIQKAKAPVKVTHRAIRSEDIDGNKMVNEYVRQCVIGRGSYGKVVLHRSLMDGNLYAIKVFRKSRLRKVRVAPLQTAMTDVLREVEIMKTLDHPRVVGLIEVIDDPTNDHFYMVLEYVEGRRIFEGAGPSGGIGEATARSYFIDVVEGLMYLHKQNVIHGDIKPENLLVSREGRIKIGDFGISQAFKDNNDEIHRSPGTPVFTAPECCSGSAYHGKAADVWALGITLYCMLFGSYPFIGDTLQDVYDKIVHNPLQIPEASNPDVVNLLQGLLCKDPKLRLTLDKVSQHPWVVRGLEPLLQDSTEGCKR